LKFRGEDVLQVISRTWCRPQNDIRGLKFFITYVSIAPRRRIASEGTFLAYVFFICEGAGGNIHGEGTPISVFSFFGGKQCYVFFEGPPQKHQGTKQNSAGAVFVINIEDIRFAAGTARTL
jgi:hypothetical protein